MISAIRSSAAAAAAAPVPRPPLTLDAQLARYQAKLADCVNCDSAKTQQGQLQIAEISSEIHAIKAQMGSAAASTVASPVPGYNSHGLRPAGVGSRLDTFV